MTATNGIEILVRDSRHASPPRLAGPRRRAARRADGGGGLHGLRRQRRANHPHDSGRGRADHGGLVQHRMDPCGVHTPPVPARPGAELSRAVLCDPAADYPEAHPASDLFLHIDAQGGERLIAGTGDAPSGVNSGDFMRVYTLGSVPAAKRQR